MSKQFGRQEPTVSEAWADALRDPVMEFWRKHHTPRPWHVAPVGWVGQGCWWHVCPGRTGHTRRFVYLSWLDPTCGECLVRRGEIRHG